MKLTRSESVKLTRKIMVKNAMGLHMRPASVIVKILQPFKSSVHFTCNNETVNARSIMSILMLAVKKGAQVMVCVEGEDAQSAMNVLVQGFEGRFGEA